MDRAEFWAMVEAARPTCGGDCAKHAARMMAALTELPTAGLGSLGDAWRMFQGTTTGISGPQRSIPIRGLTSADGVTSLASPRSP
jgi:hypothetical protein